MQLTPKEAMLLAIEEGKKGAGFANPNPLVGCVILDRNFNLIGKSYHAKFGENHAEINALNMVKDPATLAGAHFYVTLEPCAHEGKTPSCAKALAKLPIASLTYGLEDPYPLVSGKGAQILKDGGKAVTLYSELRAELEELCEIFLTTVQKKRPFVAMKVAATLDGKIALPDGSSRWITGEKSRDHVQFLRGCYDAVVVGAGTFLQDDPRLNSRDPRFMARAQKAVILDPDGRIFSKLESSQLLKVRGPGEVYVITRAKNKTSLPVRQLILPATGGQFQLKDVLQALQAEKIYSVFIEGGAQTYAGFINQHLVDRLYLFKAPKIMGEGLSWSAGVHASRLDSFQCLAKMRTEKFGDDVLLTGLMQ